MQPNWFMNSMDSQELCGSIVFVIGEIVRRTITHQCDMNATAVFRWLNKFAYANHLHAKRIEDSFHCQHISFLQSVELKPTLEYEQDFLRKLFPLTASLVLVSNLERDVITCLLTKITFGKHGKRLQTKFSYFLFRSN